MGFETQEEAERWAEQAELAADARRENQALSMYEKADAKARKEAEEMRPYLAGLSHDDLLHNAVKLYEQGARLRNELDEIMKVIR